MIHIHSYEQTSLTGTCHRLTCQYLLLKIPQMAIFILTAVTQDLQNYQPGLS